jgi:SAM-dependent methyltransferase
MNVRSELAFLARDFIYPGLDLHTRHRATLRRFWKSGPRRVLDAGSGNGYQSWLAYRSGAAVVGFSFDREQVIKSRSYLIEHKGANPARLRFEQRNLYLLCHEHDHFDEIICYETLEHIRDDSLVVGEFYRLLNPGGVVHVCCPNREHPRHQREVLDLEERGGHVRAGYTFSELADLLGSAGFTIDQLVGLGSVRLYIVDAMIRSIRNRVGDLVALPLLPLVLPFVWFDPADPPQPFSIYVRGTKQC